MNRWEGENILKAYDWVERTKPKDIFNETFILRLHQRMFGDVWKWAGKFRRSDKNIGIPWHEVPVAINNLCEDAILWIHSPSESPGEMAARFHHRLIWIHPFPNGNGRHARLLTDIFLEHVLGRKPFSWGGRNLVKKGVSRKTYIEALHAADDGDLKPLLAFARS